MAAGIIAPEVMSAVAEGSMLRQFLVGGGISVLNIAIHALVMTIVVRVAQIRGAEIRTHSSLLLIGVMIPTVTVLMATHILEVIVWSLAYSFVHAAPAAADVTYFAFVNYTALGYGDVTPVERSWPANGDERCAAVRLVDGRYLRSAASHASAKPHDSACRLEHDQKGGRQFSEKNLAPTKTCKRSRFNLKACALDSASAGR
jgi:hypothetical protein